MKIILLSGGSGTRLWPLSNDSRAKQFLKVLHNEETGELESMLQRTYRHILKIVPAKDIIITSNELQVDIIHNQLGNVTIIVEPERRDTFPAISLATVYCFSELNISEHEPIIIVSVDLFVKSDFYKQIVLLEKFVLDPSIQLGLIGIRPTYNSSKYGYLIPQKWDGPVMTVGSFKEKPTEEEASHLIEQSAYWNSGVFAFSAKLLLNKLVDMNLPLSFTALKAMFYRLPKRSFDYEVVEHLSSIKALTYDGDWKDLGTWNTLTEEMSQNIIGNGAMSDDCTNSHIVNELDLPVKALGISNMVIAVSADGILVSDKPSSSKMKDMLHEGLFAQPMYEEKKWGWTRTLDIVKKNKIEVITKRVFIEQLKQISKQTKLDQSLNWTLVSGEAIIHLNDDEYHLFAGNTLEVKQGINYDIVALKDTELIEVQVTRPVDC